MQQQQQIEQEKIDYYNNLNTGNDRDENNVPINSSEETKATMPEVPTELDKGNPSIIVSPNNEVEENVIIDKDTHIGTETSVI